MKKILFLLLCTVQIYGQVSTGQEHEFDYGIKNNSTQTITTPPYLTTTGMDGTQGKIPSALIAKTSDVADSLATKENVANKSDSYTASSSTAYVSGKALVDGLGTKENSFTKNTAFNKNFGTAAGTVIEGGTLGSNAYSSTAYLPLSGGTISGNVNVTGTFNGVSGTFSSKLSTVGVTSVIESNGGFNTVSSNVNTLNTSYTITNSAAAKTVAFTAGKSGISQDGFGFNNVTDNTYPIWVEADGSISLNSNTTVTGSVTATSFNGSATLTGTPTAPTAAPGTTGNQIATLDYVLANAPVRPYKVYTALYSQNSTSNPTVVILENTLGTVTFTRSSNGVYLVNSSGLFTADKTFVIMGAGTNAAYTNAINLINSSTFSIVTKVSSTQADADSANTKVAFEIRVYN